MANNEKNGMVTTEQKEKKPGLIRRGFTKIGNTISEVREHPAVALIGAGLGAVGTGLAIGLKCVLQARCGVPTTVETDFVQQEEPTEEDIPFVEEGPQDE